MGPGRPAGAEAVDDKPSTTKEVRRSRCCCCSWKAEPKAPIAVRISAIARCWTPEAVFKFVMACSAWADRVFKLAMACSAWADRVCAVANSADA